MASSLAERIVAVALEHIVVIAGVDIVVVILIVILVLLLILLSQKLFKTVELFHESFIVSSSAIQCCFWYDW